MALFNQICKHKFSLESLFLAWFPANLYVRRSLANVERLHDYTMAPNPGEVPFHDVKDKMSGSIRMLCFWINVNILYRLGNHFVLFLRNIVNYVIDHFGRKSSNIQTPGPNELLIPEKNVKMLPPGVSRTNKTAKQDTEQLEKDFEKVPKDESAGSVVPEDQVAASGCVAW